eukprot:scaffold9191_cov114-Cylindrotheca_fusiformis.AAC.28
MMKTFACKRAVRLSMQRLDLLSQPQRWEPIAPPGLGSQFIVPLRNGQLLQSSHFSTGLNVTDSKIDLSGLDDEQLKQLAMKQCRQGNPSEAQAILERLSSDSPGEKELNTSIMDAWIKYQAKCHAALKDAVSDEEDAQSKAHSLHLKEMCHSAERASDLLYTMDDPSSHHFVAVLSLWANACEASYESGALKIDFVRGIPQRAQHILNLQANPTVESYNQVLKAWAYSGEHLRGTMSEQLFQKIVDPNGESYKNIIRAWCWSKERRSAFTATGYFMRMMRLLDTGRLDMEPSLNDYHVLFRAWTRAE